MENEKNLGAYHESARVVFAYLNGFMCDSMELAAKDAITNSKLNAGSNIKFIQAVLGGHPGVLLPAELNHGIDVAKKLMAIYCAGTCAEIFLENNLKIPAELEINIKGQDLTMIEKAQVFLQKGIADHSDDFPSETIASVFKKLQDPDVWKAVQTLADEFAAQGYKLTRFQIEDILMAVGLDIKKPTTKSGFSLGVLEDEDDKITKESQVQTPSFDDEEPTPIDLMVKDFLRKIKGNWSDAELKAAVDHLHKIYQKYGQH